MRTGPATATPQIVHGMRTVIAVNTLGLPAVTPPVGIAGGLPEPVHLIGPATARHVVGAGDRRRRARGDLTCLAAIERISAPASGDPASYALWAATIPLGRGEWRAVHRRATANSRAR
jgi:hypothetical protein